MSDETHSPVTDALHRLLVASVVDYAIYGLTPEGRVATWNAGAERLKGYSEQEIVGRSVSDFYPPEARNGDGVSARALELLEKAARDGRAEDEGWRVRRDGTRFWANVIVTPVRDAQGSLLGFAKVTRDLTARLAAEEHARKLAAEQAARAEAERAELEMRELYERLQEQAAELEAQTEEAQSLAEELEQTNELLLHTASDNEGARARAESLQRVTAILASARSMADVGRVFSRQLGSLLGADTAWVGVITADGSAVEAVGWAGYPEAASSQWMRLPLDAGVALTDVVRSATPQWWSTREELIAAYPARAGVVRSTAQESVAVLPLLGSENDATPGGVAHAIGGIVVGFHARQEFDSDTKAFFVALAQQCAQAVARARAFEAERVARAEADTARRRAEVLQSVTAKLAGAESSATVARTALGAAIEAGEAKSGTVALLSDDGEWFEKIADVGFPGPAISVWDRFPRAGGYPAADVVASGTAQFITDRAEYLRRYPTLEPTLEALGVSSSAILPLTAAGRGAVVGYFSLHYPDAHSFSADEVTFLRAITQVTAQALERAHLYEAERKARAEAEAANQAKGQFLATMSHELRTPLNAIAGHAELIELGIHGPITPEQRAALVRIQRSQKHLLSLINEVLNHARLEAGMVQYDVRDVRVATVLAGVESLMQPQVRAKGLRLTVDRCDPELTVRADAEKLGQVLLNLLSNAVKFTESGEISVSAHARAGTGADQRPSVQITVSDTGVGVAPDQLERIFEPFVQVGRSLSTPGEGTGLGLAISRDLARGMGGDLTAHSAPGQGSSFVVTLQQSSAAQ